MILLCEGKTKPVIVEMSEVQDLLYDDIKEKKFRLEMAQEFRRILEEAEITNFLDPESSQSPKRPDNSKVSTTASKGEPRSRR